MSFVLYIVDSMTTHRRVDLHCALLHYEDILMIYH